MGFVVVIARRNRREVEPDVEPVEEIDEDDVGDDPSRLVVVARKRKPKVKGPRTAADLTDDEFAAWQHHLRQLEVLDPSRYYAAGGVPPTLLLTRWDIDLWDAQFARWMSSA